MKISASNKKAYHDYEILEKHEAGLKLLGHEVKSVKTGHVSMKGSFIASRQQKKIGKLPEFYLINTHIPLYKFASNVENYNPERERKILLNSREIKRLMGKKQEQGLALVPLKIYEKRGLLKLEFGLARGKKKYDKRESIKKKDLDRQTKLIMKRRNA